MASDFLPVDEDTEWHFKFSFLPLTPMPQLNFLSLPSLFRWIKIPLWLYFYVTPKETNKHHCTHSNTLYNSWSSYDLHCTLQALSYSEGVNQRQDGWHHWNSCSSVPHCSPEKSLSFLILPPSRANMVPHSNCLFTWLY